MALRKVHTEHNQANRALFDEIYARYQKAIYLNICKIVQDPEGVKDVLQEVFIALWENLHKVETAGSIAPWLFVVSHNKALSYLKRKVKESLVFVENLEAFEAMPAQLFQDNELAVEQLAIVKHAVEQLSDKRKEVFTLNKFEGKSIEEIADKLDLTPATVREYLKQSIRTIRTCLESPEQTSSSPVALALLLLVVH